MEWKMPYAGIIVNTMAGEHVGCNVNEIRDDIFPEPVPIREYVFNSGKNKGKKLYIINFER